MRRSYDWDDSFIMALSGALASDDVSMNGKGTMEEMEEEVQAGRYII